MPELSPAAKAVGRFFVLLLLIALAAASFIIGVGAIRDQELEWTSRSSTSLGPVVLERSTSANRAVGPDAVRMGAGFVAVGAALVAWAGGVLVLVVGPKGRLALHPQFWACLAWASITFIAGAALCFAPPWRFTSIGLYIVVPVWFAYFYGVSIRRVPKELGAPIFIAAIVAAFTTEPLLGDGSFWFGVGTLGCFGVLAHMPVAAPRF